MAKVTGVSNYIELVGSYNIYDDADNLLYEGDNMMSNNYIYQDVDVTNIVKQFIDCPDYSRFFKHGAKIIDTRHGYSGEYGVVVDGDITKIGFLDSDNITSLYLPATLISTGIGKLQNLTNLKNVYMYSSTNIDQYTFNSSGIELFKMNISDVNRLCTIGEGAFSECSMLKDVYLPIYKITSIGDSAFVNCTSLKNVYFFGSVVNLPTLGEDIFLNCTSLENIYVASNVVNAFKAALPEVADKIKAYSTTPNLSFRSYPNNILVYQTDDNSVLMPRNEYFNKSQWGNVIYNGVLYNTFNRHFNIYSNDTEEYPTYYWDYSGKNDYEDDNKAILRSYGIQDYVYYGQYFPIVMMVNNGYPHYEYLSRITISSDNDDESFLTNKSNFAIMAQLLDDNLEYVSNTEYVEWQDDANYTIDGTHYKMKSCVPENTKTLYYVNLNGGLSWCHFECKNIKDLNVERNQITHAKTTNEAFGIDNYQIITHNEYTLNTDWLNDVQSEKLAELFKSPKVWMYDYETNTIKSVVLTDNTYTMKRRFNDKLFNYTVKCVDSNKDSIFI
jgi:hypothetical protein